MRIKYGPSWTTPSKSDWAQDVVEMIPRGSFPGRGSRLGYLLARNIFRWRVGRLRVLDAADNPVGGATVTVAGLGRSKTNEQGYARLYLPGEDFYALIINHGGHKELLYEEKMVRVSHISTERIPRRLPAAKASCQRNKVGIERLLT